MVRRASAFRKSLTLAIALSCAVLAQAETVRWTGSVDNKWSTPGNWDSKSVPGENDSAVLNRTTEMTIEVDGDFTVKQVLFGLSTQIGPEEGRYPVCTLMGDGSITTTGACYLYTKRQVVLAGNVTFKPTDLHFSSGTDATLEVRDNVTYVCNSYFSLLNGVRFKMTGGTMFVKTCTLAGHSSFEMTGGEFHVTGSAFTTCDETSTVSITGGTFHNNTSIYQNDPAFLPKGKDAAFVCTVVSENSLYVPTGPGIAYDMPGKIFVTNAAHAAAYVRNTDDIFWGGRGEIYAEIFRFAYPCRADLDLSKLCIGQLLYPGSTAVDARLDTYHDIEIGAFGDWNSETDNRVASIRLHGPVTVDTTDCFDGTTPHAVTFQNVYPMLTTALRIEGAGKVDLNVRRNVFTMDSLTVAPGSTLNTLKSLRPLATRTFTVGAGSTLELKAGSGMIESFGTPVIDPSATVKVSLPGSPVAGAHYPVVSSGTGAAIDISNFSIADADPGAWQLKSDKGFVYLSDGTEPEKTSDTEWIGPDNGTWSVGANWKGGVAPNAKDKMAFFKGKACTVTNDLAAGTLSIQGLDFGDGGPFVIAGNKMTLNSGGLGGSTDAIMVKGSMPVTIDADIQSSSSTGWFTININANTYAQFNGDIDAMGWGGIGLIGEARFSGNVTCNSLYVWKTRECRNSRAVILPGCKFTCKSQTNNGFICSPAGDGSDLAILCVCAGGEMAYAGGSFYWTSPGAHHEVNGLLDVKSTADYRGRGDIYFDGTGTVAIAQTSSMATTAGSGSRTWLGTGLTFRPGDRWNTVTTASPSNTVVLGVDSYATIAVTGDFAYGPEPGLATTTTSAQRAFRLPRPMCTLTLDVGNPDAAVQPVATFEDPIVGYGKVVKAGLGTLALASAENAITGGVSVVAGTLAWTAPQTLPGLSADAGTTLAFGSADGAPAKLTVGSDTDLTNVAIVPLDASAAAALEDGYVDIVEAAEGATLTGTPVAPDGCTLRLVDGRLQMKQKSGMLLIVR